MSKLPNDPTTGKNSERLNELAFSFKKSQALVAALECGLFTAISSGASTPEEIGAYCHIDPETADRLLIICKALDLVGEVDGRNVNLDDVERFLVQEAPTYFGDYLRFTVSTEYEEWQGYTGNLKDVSSEVPPRKLYEGDLDDADRAREFTQSGYNASLPLAHRLAKRFDFSRFKHWLDFAGGSGCYAIAACERHDGIQVTVKDHPNVVPVATEFIAKHNLQDRITAQPGDFLKAADYGGDYDLISFITPLHWYLRDDVIKTLRHAYDGNQIVVKQEELSLMGDAVSTINEDRQLLNG